MLGNIKISKEVKIKPKYLKNHKWIKSYFGHTKLEWGEVYFYIYTTNTSSAREAGALVSGPVHIHLVTLSQKDQLILNIKVHLCIKSLRI